MQPIVQRIHSVRGADREYFDRAVGKIDRRSAQAWSV
jgi:hypothetical protein